jgi:cellulose synthase/poly-beta-1,6-N-acetylglucosamine synthase-like glycosyltransferase
VVIAAANEAERLPLRIANLFASNYPANCLEVVVVSDGSTDGTVASVRAISDARVRCLEFSERRGKAACLNDGIAAVDAQTEILLFTDCRQEFEPETIPRLVRHFSDGKVGAVSGELEIRSASSTTGAGVDAYWKLERILRASEAALDSCIGCTGAVYAIRRAAYCPIPPDTILDDVVIPITVSLKGFRVLHDPEAVAYDPQPLEPEKEKRRKTRTLAGNFQMLFRYPSWLLPWRNRLWWQIISHKYLRVLAPAFLMSALAGNLMLLHYPVYAFLAIPHLGIYLSAFLGATLFAGKKVRLLSLPVGFVFLNLLAIKGFWHYLTVREAHRWKAPIQ